MSNRAEDVSYTLNESGEFTIAGYQSSKLFSSFLPGVAGKLGIPMWTFYVNRGQCICSMGIEGKHKPIMEFLPANWAYNLVSSQGFRTFLKIRYPQGERFYEPFRKDPNDREMQIEQRMIVSAASLRLEEDNHTLGIRFSVDYFNIPRERFAGLARVLTMQNIGKAPLNFQLLDGLPLIIPYGIDNYGLKNIRRLVEAFVEVTNQHNDAPFFKGKVEPADRPDVVKIKQGNFYLGFTEMAGQNRLVTPIVDPVKIFGNRGDYLFPDRFIFGDFDELTRDQVLENRLPSAMGAVSSTIDPGGTFVFSSLIGHADSVEHLQSLIPVVLARDYMAGKARENKSIVDNLTQHNFILSNEPVFDHYTRQNFLDNALRGGFPYTIKGPRASTVMHLFSRKHGDLERDYNDFRLNPTPYSQGNGNFRDVNQNRRCDLYFNPDVREGNIEQFYNLIRLDGFNPLVIKEVRFAIPNKAVLEPILAEYYPVADVPRVAEILSKSFTPGELLADLSNNNIAIPVDTEAFLGDLLGNCEKLNDTVFHEGYWTDHWTYNLDLVENYLAVYPEKRQWLLFDHQVFTYHEDAHHVVPRDDKYVIWDGNPVQLHSVQFDSDHDAALARRSVNRHLVHTGFGEGAVLRVTLFDKMLCLVINKLASLDPSGIGIEMESDRPDWYDALNGLPGQIGSSLNETLELKRLVQFVLSALEDVPDSRNFQVSEELYDFILGLSKLLAGSMTAFEYWDRATTLRELYRRRTKTGVSGSVQEMRKTDIVAFLKAGLGKIEAGIAIAWNNPQQVISTYFIHKVTDHDLLYQVDDRGRRVLKTNDKGLPCFRAKAFERVTLPLFLEGPVHFLRCNTDPIVSRKLAEHVKESGLYDKTLRMYKVNETLADQPMEIGRARTFSPGWFENESIWLHMEYKYMLELLRNRLYDIFFADFRNVLVPFMNPEVYGRSILENSSFIVSSANPDPSIHGGGFVARLSGATAEFIHILAIMSMGRAPFRYNESDGLQLVFEPVLPAWLFTEKPQTANLSADDTDIAITLDKDTFTFMFLGCIPVTYHNPLRRDTFGRDGVIPVACNVTMADGSVISQDSGKITGDLAYRIRDRQVRRIDIRLG